jgi:Uma2 family endonuclease
MSTITTVPPSSDAPVPPPIPPLHNGDRLTREEFHRRYEAMPQLKKAELIEGVVYMPSPVRQDQHSKQHSHLNGWLVAYRAATPGVETGDNASLLLDPKNMPQPDSLLYILPECGGRARINDGGYMVGGPEWIGEVSASTASYDLHDKLEAYRRNGVREYVVWRVEDGAIDWFVLRGDRYEPLTTGADGLLKSEVFPGLWLDPKALLAGNLLRVLEVVQAGVKSPEHAAFVERLAMKRKS